MSNYNEDKIENKFRIVVEGKRACFTMPQFKTEAISYDYPTPSAMVGLVESIYWKPAIRIEIDKIVVFNPIKRQNIMRRVIRNKRVVKNKCAEIKHIDVSDSTNVAIKNTNILLDVKYGIEFHIVYVNEHITEPDENIDKHLKIMHRRLSKCQCAKHPYFGHREFSVDKVELVDSFNLDGVDKSLRGDYNLNYMLYDLQFVDDGKPINNDWNNPIYSDIAKPRWYNPHIIDGVIDVEKYRRTIIC